MRSWLFVPGDSEKKLTKAFSGEADVLIVDWEDSVAPSQKAQARKVTADAIDGAGGSTAAKLFVRVNALGSAEFDDDIAALSGIAPDGVVLPKSTCGADVTALASRLSVAEAEGGIDDGHIRIAAIATETAGSLFQLGSYRGASARLCGLAWGAEDLSADLGAEERRGEGGEYTDIYRMARVLCLAGAVAADVQPIDTVFTDFKDDAGLEAETENARRDGFTGKLAIHPAQVPVINRVFTPSEAAIRHAEMVVATFASATHKGVVSLDGKMLDRPHLKQAERILARAKAIERQSSRR
ncbi:MAG: CoA ester lyase [Hyphomicrobiales bacterium]|nr:CoA ester lyase [Hyphomicrobiales bacterium]